MDRSSAAPRDFWGGLALIGLALFALWASRDLPGMRGFAFGPGTAPRMFAIVLGLLGLAVSVTGLTTKGPGIDRFYFRGPFFITLSVGLFAWMVRPLGLVIASFLSILAAAGATPGCPPHRDLHLGRVADGVLLPVVPGRPQSAVAVVAEQLGTGRHFQVAFRLPMKRMRAAVRINSACKSP